MPLGGLLSAGQIHRQDNTVLKQPHSLAQKSLNLVWRFIPSKCSKTNDSGYSYKTDCWMKIHPSRCRFRQRAF